MSANGNLFRGILKLKTLCVGGDFSKTPTDLPSTQFPGNVLTHTDVFQFYIEAQYCPDKKSTNRVTKREL